MSKLKLKRREIIFRLMAQYGAEYAKDTYVMTIWDLADNINNTWNAEHFVNTKRYKSAYGFGRKFALPHWNTMRIHAGIRHACRGYDKPFKYCVGNNGVEFLVMKV